MSRINYFPFKNGLLRAVAATRREIVGVNQSIQTTPLRSFGIAPRRPPQAPRQLSQQLVLCCCVRSRASSNSLITCDPRASRKRQLGQRSLSTRTPDSESVSGSQDGGSNSRTNNSSPCWKCNSAVGRREYFCECGAAQLLDERLNYFEMFGCHPSVSLELREVEKRFKKMQRAFHPDLFASKCEDEQEISAANSATANKAYQTLVQPMARVKYLMRLLGSTALEEGGDDDKTPVPMDFLMEIMQTRESLERCSSQDEAEAVLAETSAAVGECLRGMDEVLKAGGGKDELSDAAVRLRYLYRIEDEARRIRHRLQDGLGNPTAG